jgi:hypothetical protein
VSQKSLSGAIRQGGIFLGTPRGRYGEPTPSMFKPIGGTLDKKKKDLIQAGGKNSEISAVFDKFLKKYFAEYRDSFKWEASYSLKDGKVVINTGSKLIAGELSMKIKELSILLKEANLRVTQIVIV